MLVADITDLLRTYIWFIVAGLVGLIVIIAVIKALFGGEKKHKNLQQNLQEDLASYPPAPARSGTRKLFLDGIEVRIRFVVVAPMGKQHDPIDADDVTEILNDVLRGLGTHAAADKARMKIWPPQLSAGGFAPSFFRLVDSPDAEGKKSHWIRVAGPAKSAGKPILLGFALYTDEENKLGRVTLEGKEWVESFKVENQ